LNVNRRHFTLDDRLFAWHCKRQKDVESTVVRRIMVSSNSCHTSKVISLSSFGLARLLINSSLPFLIRTGATWAQNVSALSNKCHGS
jgi:hypothetical protein